MRRGPRPADRVRAAAWAEHMWRSRRFSQHPSEHIPLKHADSAYSSGDVLLRCPGTFRCRSLAPAMSCSAFLQLVAKAVSARSTTSPSSASRNFDANSSTRTHTTSSGDTRGGHALRQGGGQHAVACVDVWRFGRKYATRHRGMKVAWDDDRIPKINWSDSADFLRLRAGSSGDVGQTRCA